jgi:hypothetical protein
MPAKTTNKKSTWEKGRGKLGALAPLPGEWEASADDTAGFRWAVEARNKQGWSRFTEYAKASR